MGSGLQWKRCTLYLKKEEKLNQYCQTKTSDMVSLEGLALLSTSRAHQGLLILTKFASLAYTIGIAFVSSHERGALFFSTPGQSMVRPLTVEACVANWDAKKSKA